jgi:hypothetical protein
VQRRDPRSLRHAPGSGWALHRPRTRPGVGIFDDLAANLLSRQHLRKGTDGRPLAAMQERFRACAQPASVSSAVARLAGAGLMTALMPAIGTGDGQYVRIDRIVGGSRSFAVR